MTVEKYAFWYMIEKVVDKLEKTDLYNRDFNWERNFVFKENLESDIKIFDGLLENKLKIEVNNDNNNYIK